MCWARVVPQLTVTHIDDSNFNKHFCHFELAESVMYYDTPARTRPSLISPQQRVSKCIELIQELDVNRL